MEELDRHVARHLSIVSPEDGAHSAAPELFLQVEALVNGPDLVHDRTLPLL